MATLFLEARVAVRGSDLWLGRANFAAVAFAAYLALHFVRQAAGIELNGVSGRYSWLTAETWILATLTLLTPLVSAAERVESGRAITTFGVLFPLYLLHVLGCLAAAGATALRERRWSEDQAVRNQLGLVGTGIVTTGGIAAITNALLPYAFRDFRFCDIGTLSTLAFVLTTAYATFIHRLFDLRAVVRETLVYGVLLAFVLGAYSASIFLVTQYLTSGAEPLTQFSVLVIAFSLDPLRRFLEEKTDRLLFGTDDGSLEPGDDRGKVRPRARRRLLPLLSLWRRSS
jgi:hypothetical protein